MQLSEFCVLDHLGTGTFGSCKKVCLRRDKSKVYAWKEVEYGQFTENEKRMLVQEVNLLRGLRHQYIVAYECRIVDSCSSTIYVVMEFCSGGDLGRLIGGFERVNRLLPYQFVPEQFVWRVCLQLLEALDYCHSGAGGNSGPILHRDIKPANVLLDNDWNVKLADFGLSRVLSTVQSLATTFVGSPMYMSPELLGDGYTNPKSDIWALGCVLHELMALRAPFEADSEQLLRLRISTGSCCHLPVTFSLPLRQLAKSLLTVDIHERPSASWLLSQAELKRRRLSAVGHSWQEILRQSLKKASLSSGDAESLELLALQRRLESRESQLLLREAAEEERRERLRQAEAEAEQTAARLQAKESELSQWERSLHLLNQSLAEKQQLLEDKRKNETRRESRHTNRRRWQRQALTALPTNISPIVPPGGFCQKQQESPAVGSYCPQLKLPTPQARRPSNMVMDGTYEPRLNLRASPIEQQHQQHQQQPIRK